LDQTDGAGIRPHLLPLATLLVLVAAVYWRVWDHSFLVNWDDNVYVTGNEAAHGLSLPNLRAAFTRFFVGNYAPLQIVSYMVDYDLWGLRAGGFLLTNVLLHGASGLLFYALLVRLHGRRLWAFVGAFVFLLHPVQVESVAWVSQRKNVLAMVFFLLALLLYRVYAEGGPRRRHAYAGALAAFILALLAKAVVVVLPLLLVCLDLCFLERGAARRRLADKLPFILAAAGVGVLTLVSQDAAIGGGRSEYWGGSLGTTLLTMVPVTVRYLGMVLWPRSLSPAYAQPFKDGVDGSVALSALVLCVLAAGTVWLFRRDRRLAFWPLFAGIAFLPVSQVVPLVTLMNDRYLYFPILGAAALAGAGASIARDHLGRQGRRICLAATALLLLPLPYFSQRQAAVWADTTTLWRHAVTVEPACSLAWLGYGHSLMNDGYPREALDALLRAYALYPSDEDTLLNLGLIYKRIGTPLEGRPFLLALVREAPANRGGWEALGENYLATGEYGPAAEALRRALALRPDDGGLLGQLADISLVTGALDASAELYGRGLAAGGDPARLEYGLAAVAARQGRTAEALSHLEAACRSGFSAFARLRGDGNFAALRSRPEFAALLARYGGR
jgi:Tfp pilus assembly protein PilF